MRQEQTTTRAAPAPISGSRQEISALPVEVSAMVTTAWPSGELQQQALGLGRGDAVAAEARVGADEHRAVVLGVRQPAVGAPHHRGVQRDDVERVAAAEALAG